MSKPVIFVDIACVSAPGWVEWLTKASEHFRIEFILEMSKDQNFLTISDRVMQFRGDWNVWWLDPDNLKDFRAWHEAGHKPCSEV